MFHLYPPRVLIVDAFNVVHAAPATDPRLGGLSIESLCALIAGSRWRSGGDDRAVLVVDGTGGGLAGRLPPDHHLQGVRVQFAGPGKDADSAIELLLDDQERKRAAHRCTVVSSDKRLKAAAAGVRAKWMSSTDFLKTLVDDADRTLTERRRRTGGKPERVAQSGETGLGSDEAAFWLREFGLAPQSRPPGARSGARVDDRPGTMSEAEKLSRQIAQEWGETVSPDDLDMGKLLKGTGGAEERSARDDDHTHPDQPRRTKKKR